MTMKRKNFRLPDALTFAVLLGLLVAAPALAAGEGADQDKDVGSVSPSQISRDRINAILANEFFYQSYGKADPFGVLVAGDFEKSSASELVDMNSARLVGVMWGQDDKFALVEDGEGFGYILRVGDRVRHGRVVSIRKNSLTARVTLYGITNNISQLWLPS
jgi:hypothetical protein